jgi:hypothetical protein
VASTKKLQALEELKHRKQQNDKQALKQLLEHDYQVKQTEQM